MRKSLIRRLATGIAAASLAYSPVFPAQAEEAGAQSKVVQSFNPNEKFFPNTLVKPEKVREDLNYLSVPKEKVEELTGYVMSKYDGWVSKLVAEDELRGGEVSLARKALDKYPALLVEALQQVPGADFVRFDALKAELLQRYWFDKNFNTSGQPRSYDLEGILGTVASDSVNDPEIAAAVRQYNAELTPIISRGIKLYFDVLDPTDGKLDLDGKPKDFRDNVTRPYGIFKELEDMNYRNAELIASKLGDNSRAFKAAVDNARYPGMEQINAEIARTTNLYNDARTQAMNRGDEVRLAELESIRTQLESTGAVAKQAIIAAYNEAFNTARIGNLATELYNLNEGIKGAVREMRTYDDIMKRRMQIAKEEMPPVMYSARVQQVTKTFQKDLNYLTEVINSN